jgi:hypothetical protein
MRPGTPSISFAAIVPARSRLDFGRPVRLVRLRPGALPQTLRTPPHGGRPVLRGQRRRLSGEKRPTRRRPVGSRRSPRPFPRPEPISCHRRSSSVAPPLVSSNTSHARRGITPRLWLRIPPEERSDWTFTARNMRRPAHTTSRSASERRIGTQCLQFLPRHAPSCDQGARSTPVQRPAVSPLAFSRSVQEPQTRFTSLSRRAPPGPYTGTCQALSRGCD